MTYRDPDDGGRNTFGWLDVFVIAAVAALATAAYAWRQWHPLGPGTDLREWRQTFGDR